MSYIDQYHTYLEGQVNKPAIWFDNFFGDPRVEEDELPTSFVRLRLTARYTEGESFEFPVRIRANIKLPKASDKLRLVILGENPEEFQTTRPGEDLANVTGEEADADRSSVGLRYTIYKSLRSNLHFGGGTSSLSPFEYYLRASYRRYLHIRDDHLVEFRQTGFWNSIEGFGETSRIDYEKKLVRGIVGRLSLFGTYSEVSYGVNWGLENNYYRNLNPKAAVSFELGAYGITRPSFETTVYRIGVRTRANVIRPWLFLEITPEVNFPLSDPDKRQAVGVITFSMEIQFLAFD